MDDLQRAKANVGKRLAEAVLDLDMRGMWFSRSQYANTKRDAMKRLAGQYMTLHLPAAPPTPEEDQRDE